MIYVLYGENDILIDKYIKNIIKENNITDKIVYDYDTTSIEDIVTECAYNSLFNDKKLVVVNNSIFLTGKGSLESEVFTNYIHSVNPNTYLVLKVNSDKLDERKKIVKELKEVSVVKCFSLIGEKDIISYAKSYFESNNKKIDYDALREISLRINSNTKVLDSELNKLLIYKINSDNINLDDVKKVITKYEEEGNIFKLVNAVINKDKASIFNLYKDLIENKEEPQVIISLLESNIRLILCTKILLEEGYTKEKIVAHLKEHPYRVGLSINSSRNISLNELVKMLKYLSILDYEIKTGVVDRFKGLEAYFINL